MRIVKGSVVGGTAGFYRAIGARPYPGRRPSSHSPWRCARPSLACAMRPA